MSQFLSSSRSNLLNIAKEIVRSFETRTMYLMLFSCTVSFIESVLPKVYSREPKERAEF